MPVITALFGGSRRDGGVFSSSSLDSWNALDGFSLFPAPRRVPSKEMAPFANTRVKTEKTTGHHRFEVDLLGLGMEDVRLKVEGRVLQVCGEKRIGKGKDHRCPGGETSTAGFRRRIVLPEDAEVDQVQAAARKGVLIITTPRKEMRGVKPV